MKHTLLTLVLIGTFACQLTAAPQQSAAVADQELVDSSAVNGVDVFSDTTAVDTGSQQATSSQTTYSHSVQIDDLDDLDDLSDFFSLGTGMMILISILTLLVPFLFFVVPILVILLLLFLVLRNRKRQPVQDAFNQNTDNNSQIDDHMPTNKQLCRSNNRILGGVCAGLAEYIDIDPTVVRVIYVLLTFFTAFSGVLIYVILLLVMPQKRF